MADDRDHSRTRWDKRHTEADDLGTVAQVLTLNRHLLPAGGMALDLACGRGANALYLVRAGLQVSAWDFSPVAISRLEAAAAESNLQVSTEVRNLLTDPPPTDSFDVILVAHFLERSLAPAIAAALKPGGLLFYQTFNRHGSWWRGPSNPDFRLADNELLRLFPTLRLRFYREDRGLGGEENPDGDLAMLLAQRPERGIVE